MNFLTKDDTSVMITILKKLLVVILLTIGIFPSHISAGEKKVPVDLQVKLFLTALTYDKNLKGRADEKLNIGIVYFPNVVHSKEEALGFFEALEEFKDKKVKGLALDKFLIAYRGSNDLKKIIAGNTIRLLYIATGIKNDIKDITEATESAKVLSITSETEYVVECGVSMAVGMESTKPRIYLNLSSSRAEGANFNAKLLRVVKVLGKNNK